MTQKQTNLFDETDSLRRQDDEQFAHHGLANLQQVLNVLPLQPIIDALRHQRGHGRNDYPPAAMLAAFVARIVLQLGTVQNLVAALRCNPQLMRLCGFDITPQVVRHSRPVRTADGWTMSEPITRWRCPTAAAFCRFQKQLAALETQTGLVSDMQHELVTQLMAQCPDFGQALGFDGKWIASWANGRSLDGPDDKDRTPDADTPPPDTDPAPRRTARTGDPDATWGAKTTYVKGRKKCKKNTCFGYAIMVFSDVNLEVPVFSFTTPASSSEVKTLDRLLPQLFDRHPQLAQRAQSFVADRGLDSGPLKATLWDRWQIRPIIDNRQLWTVDRQQPDVRQGLSHTKTLEPYTNVSYDEHGALHCYCPHTAERRAMTLVGYERDRGTLRFRCPAKQTCIGFDECLQDNGSQARRQGLSVRVPLQFDRRLFTPTPRCSSTWRRWYARRSATERINARLGGICGLDRRHTRGLAQTALQVLLATVIQQAVALSAFRHGQPRRTRSLRHLALPQAA